MRRASAWIGTSLTCRKLSRPRSAGERTRHDHRDENAPAGPGQARCNGTLKLPDRYFRLALLSRVFEVERGIPAHVIGEGFHQVLNRGAGCGARLPDFVGDIDRKR